MHAVGFWHEQSRPDRDEHVTIKWENINRKNRWHNFKKHSLSMVNMVGQYDFCSLMHYGLSDFGKYKNWYTRLKTIVPKHKRYRKYCLDHEIGERQDFSPGDIEKLNILYNCNSKKGEYILNTKLYVLYAKCFYINRCPTPVPRARGPHHKREGVADIQGSVPMEVMSQEVPGDDRLPLLDLLQLVQTSQNWELLCHIH